MSLGVRLSWQCYIYQIPQPGSAKRGLKLVAHWEKELPRIRMVAISPDSQFAAFLLDSAPSDTHCASLHIVSLSCLGSVGSDQ
jgi:hypothetical protein